MKNELIRTSSLPDLRSEAEELLSSEMFEIKGGTANGCTSCESGCQMACSNGCTVCTGCVTGSWIL